MKVVIRQDAVAIFRY